MSDNEQDVFLKNVFEFMQLCDKHNTHEIAKKLAFHERRCPECICHENEQLKKALAFYANPESYIAMVFLADPPCGGFAYDFSQVENDLGVRPGHHAREVLTALYGDYDIQTD